MVFACPNSPCNYPLLEKLARQNSLPDEFTAMLLIVNNPDGGGGRNIPITGCVWSQNIYGIPYSVIMKTFLKLWRVEASYTLVKRAPARSPFCKQKRDAPEIDWKCLSVPCSLPYCLPWARRWACAFVMCVKRSPHYSQIGRISSVFSSGKVIAVDHKSITWSKTMVNIIPTYTNTHTCTHISVPKRARI